VTALVSAGGADGATAFGDDEVLLDKARSPNAKAGFHLESAAASISRLSGLKSTSDMPTSRHRCAYS
jgi:hypothetical protein